MKRMGAVDDVGGVFNFRHRCRRPIQLAPGLVGRWMCVLEGTLVWSLGQIWTAPAWSTIQHDGNWKMAHYRMRKVFEDVHVSFQQQQVVYVCAFALASCTLNMEPYSISL